MQSPFPSSGPAPGAVRGPVRVLHCIPTLEIGGAETQLKLLAPCLVARGVDVAVFGRFADSDVQALAEGGVTCFPLQSRGNYDPAIATELLRVVQTWRPTVIQTWLTQMDILGGAAALIRNIPWIVAERSSPPAYPPSLRNFIRQWLGRRAVLVANAPQGLDVWPDHPDRQVIGNGLDLAAVSAIPHGMMRDTALFRDRISVVTVSRLVPEKNLRVLIAAIALARNHVPNIRLIIVGDGPERRLLEELVDDRGLSEYVVFAGFQSAPIEWLRSADIFASASLFEGHPNAVTEAAAAGVPTLLSDISMHRSLMGDAALYAPTDDPATFAAHVLALVQNRGQRDRIVTTAHEVVRHFDINIVAAQYAALYERLTIDRMAKVCMHRDRSA